MKQVDRYLGQELIGPWGLGLGLFAGLGVTVGSLGELTYLVSERDISLATAGQIYLLRLPEFVAYALPISVLLACLMAYGRLGHDSELLALRSIGLPVWRLILPAIALGSLVTGIAFVFNEAIVPKANQQASKLSAIANETPPTFFQSSTIFYPQYTPAERDLASFFYAEQSTMPNRLDDVLWLRYQARKLTRITTAKTAIWQQDHWLFRQGRELIIAPETGLIAAENSFMEGAYSLPRTPLLLADFREPFEMSLVELQQYLTILQATGDQQKLRTFRVRIQQKLAFPFVCLGFSFLGSILGFSPTGTGRARSFSLCVALSFGYYFVSFFLGGLGSAGVLSPLLAGWLPNCMLAIAGARFLRICDRNYP
ncbi:MAG: LptF/LptG family permease [Cyanobacteria bacterium P01_H01_bin.15]